MKIYKIIRTRAITVISKNILRNRVIGSDRDSSLYYNNYNRTKIIVIQTYVSAAIY